jgi:hypothetical protein
MQARAIKIGKIVTLEGGMQQAVGYRYDAQLNGRSIGRFNTPEDALNAICRKLRHQNGLAYPDIIDTQVQMRFDRDSIRQWCLDHT